MKRFILILLVFFGLPMILGAHTTLTKNTHAFRIGDSHDFIIAKNLDAGQGGDNLVWDYSGMEPSGKTLTSHMLDVSTTEKGSLIPDANVALEEFGNIFFFKVSKEGMEQYGTYSCNSLVKYDKPFMKLKFPVRYGDHVSGEYSGVQESGQSSIPVSGTYDVSADAYGTLLLPGNVTIDDVIRVKQVKTINNSNGKPSSEITYRWYASNIRYPLLVIIKMENSGQSSLIETAYYAHAGNSYKSAPLSIDDGVIGSSKFEVYPNPFKDQLNLKYTLDHDMKVSIDLYDNLGRLVKNIQSPVRLESGEHTLSFGVNENGLESGVYYVKFRSGDQTTIRQVVLQK